MYFRRIVRELEVQLNARRRNYEIMTTRPTGGLLAPIRGSYRPAPKDAGFHFVQAFIAFDSSQPLKGRL